MEISTAFMLFSAVVGLCLLCGLVYMIYMRVWIKALEPLGEVLTIYTPCEQDLGDPQCAPREVYDLYCRPGVTRPRSTAPGKTEPSCDAFCAGLTAITPRLCSYIDSCGTRRSDELFSTVCAHVPLGCSATTMDGCPADKARQYCLGGLATMTSCREYCQRYALCGWLEAGTGGPLMDFCTSPACDNR
jgi:hypothetical protein